MASVNANVSFSQLNKLTHGTYNMGELRLNAKGEFEKINNHVHRTGKNVVTTSADDNKKVRWAVFQTLESHYKGLVSNDVIDKVRDHLNIGRRATMSISRDEIAALISQLESISVGDKVKLALGDLESIAQYKREEHHQRDQGTEHRILGMGKRHDNVVSSRTKNAEEDQRIWKIQNYLSDLVEVMKSEGSSWLDLKRIASFRSILKKGKACELSDKLLGLSDDGLREFINKAIGDGLSRIMELAIERRAQNSSRDDVARDFMKEVCNPGAELLTSFHYTAMDFATKNGCSVTDAIPGLSGLSGASFLKSLAVALAKSVLEPQQAS